MEGMNPMQDPGQLGMMGRKAMQLGSYPDAVRIFSMGLDQVSFLNLHPHCAAPFLRDRAECFWRLGEVQASMRDMEDSLRHGLPRDDFFAEDESLKWTDYGNTLLRQNDFVSAEKCANFALFFQTSSRTKAQAYLCKAYAQYEMGKTNAARREINEIKRLDSDLARNVAQERKDFAIAIFKDKNYEGSIKHLNLALWLHPDDGSKTRFKRSVESHQAAAYFKLKNYKKAVELGEESYKTNTSYRLKEEAERWKERGNQLLSCKETNTLDQVIACYTLALKFTPEHEKDLRATILSNRCLMYKRRQNAEEALKDARDCVDIKPDWPKGQYRLGSSLLARKKYQEAMEPFAKSLQLLLRDASSSESDKIDTLTQLLSVAVNLPDGTSSIQFNIPKNLMQNVINKAVADRDWKRLHLLFLGGGGETKYKKGSGGLATGCDASSVPLEEVIRNDLPNLGKFINILLDHKANSNPPKGKKSPLDVAMELDKIDVASMLKDGNVSSRSSELPKRMFKRDGLEAMRKGDTKRAVELLQFSLKHEATKGKERLEVLQYLCELHFKEKAFDVCLDTGLKLKETYNREKDEVQATQWKKWGNELHKEGKYELMAEYYSLALDFTPESNFEITTALLSNRCLALINLEKFKEALADADRCTEIRPKWFRGHSRRGNCLLPLKRKKEALRAFCKAHTNAVTDKEKQATALDVITTAMSIEDGQSQITCTLSPKMLQYAIKEASEKGEWNKLRFLFLGTAASNTSRGLAYDSDASCVPLDLLIRSDVKNLHTLVTLLLQRGASSTGLRGCARAPLLVAMEMMKFPIAVTLLRNNADPSCIVGHGIFINREGQPKQWLQLGRKALDANDNKKAVMLLNMSLYLSESNTEKSILRQIYHGLSEAHFNLNEHGRSINAGNECFKLRPIKSEEEAKKWEVRAAHACESSAYTFCIDYVNLALKYTPADYKQMFSLLLCRRSQAFQQLGDYERALEDAKSASMMNPNMSEGYRKQLYCFRSLRRGREAMQVINECLKRTSDKNTVYDLLSDALDIAANLQEATSALTVPVPSQLIEKLTSSVIQKRD